MAKIILTEEGSTPQAPPAGSMEIYAKTDQIIYVQNPSGVETPIGTSNALTGLSGDVSATGPGVATSTVNTVGGQTASAIASATVLTNAATSANTPSTIVERDSSGNFSAGTITASLNGNASTASSTSSFSGSLSGDVTGTQSSTVVSHVGGQTASNVAAAAVAVGDATPSNTASTLVERDASGNFTANNITSSLTGNVTGNVSGSSGSFTGSLVGDVTGTQGSTVVSTVGGKSASSVAAAATAVSTATSSNTPSTIIERDSSGNFAAGTITASLNGNASTATSATSSTSFTGSLSGDVTGTQSYTVVSTVGGSSASSVANAANQVANATSSDTINTLVLRDSSGNFSAGTITANLTGNVSGNVSGSSASFTGSLSGDVTGTQSSTSVKKIQGTSVSSVSPTDAQLLIYQLGSTSWVPSSISGDVTISDSGVITVSNNAISNAKMAQMASNTIKGNNTGSSSNASDLTASQVTAMLNSFTGDTGSGGVQGMVPAPPSGSKAAGDFLSASGSWTYIDQSNPRNPDFTLIYQSPGPSGSDKFENVTIYTGLNGKTYAAAVGGGSACTLAIFDITDQTSPIMLNYAIYAGAYNVSVANISGSTYAFVPSSGGSSLYIINITNPYSWSTTSTTLISNSPGSLYSCQYYNGYVYIATQNKGLTVLDVGGGTGSLATPIQTYQEGGTTNKSFGVAVLNSTTLFTTNYATSFPATVRYLKTWTMTGAGSPSVPSLVNTYTISGGPIGTSTKPLGLTISPNSLTVFVTDGNQNVIDVIDITTPSSPNYLTYITPSYTMNSAFVAYQVGNYLYIPSGSNATNGGCIDLYDITNRSSPFKITSSYSNVANDVFGGIAINGGYIFSADYGPTAGTNGTMMVFTMPNANTVFGSGTGSNLTLESLTPSTVLVSSASNVITSSVTTATELSYVHGVTSSIQTQINTLSGSGISSLTGDVTGTGPGATATTVVSVGGSSASSVHSAAVAVANSTNTDTPNTLVSRDGSGNFSAGIITANLTGNVSGTSSNITGIAAIANGGTNSSTALNNNRIMQSSAGSIIEANAITPSKALISDVNGIPTESITTSTELSYVNGVTSSIQTQLNSVSGSAITGLTGDVSATGPGSVSSTVNSVGGSTAANIHSAEQLANAATSADTVSTIVKRDSSGNFAAGTVTLTLLDFLSGSYTGSLEWNPTASYVITLPPTGPTVGSYLVSDGSGNLSWSNPLTNIDGGSATSVYTSGQIITGGTP